MEYELLKNKSRSQFIIGVANGLIKTFAFFERN